MDELVEQEVELMWVYFDVFSIAGIVEPTGVVWVVLGRTLLCTCDTRTWETTYDSSILTQPDTSLIKAQLSAFIHEAVLSWNTATVIGVAGLSGDFDGHRP